MNSTSIEHYLNRHEKVLNDLIDSATIPAERIAKALRYALFPGGKRLRPTLVYLCGDLIGVSLPTLDIIAAAIELTHCYSLVHDDLPAMDNDDFRRGKPSCHKAFDEATAILIGDGMQALAIEVLTRHLPTLIPPLNIINVINELVKACGISGMVSGQSLDLSDLTNLAINEQQLRQIHHLKTGQLITACINMVLAAGCASSIDANALSEFAKHLGLVFQMQDDYLDRYNQTDLLGKGRASDTENQKITFANLYSKDELFILINQHFEQARLALDPFEKRADDLRFLINELQNRR